MLEQWLRAIVTGFVFGISIGALFGGVFLFGPGSEQYVHFVVWSSLVGLGLAGIALGVLINWKRRHNTILAIRWVRLYLAVIFPVVCAIQFWAVRIILSQQVDSKIIGYLAIALVSVLLLPVLVRAIVFARRTQQKERITGSVIDH